MKYYCTSIIWCQITSNKIDLKHNSQILEVLTSLALKYDIPGIEALIIQTIRSDQLRDVIANKTPHPYHLMGYATYGTRRADL